MDNISEKSFSLETMASDSCEAERFADYLESRGLMKAPSNLKSSVLERSRHLDVRLIAGTNQLSKKTELFLYGLKIGFAVACSIAVIGIAPRLYTEHSLMYPKQDKPIHMELYEKIEKWNGKLDDLSNALRDLEVSFYD